MTVRLTALVLAAALLGGCAAPMRTSLTPEQRAAIQELDTRVIVVQDEVIVDVKASNSAGAGAAFGLIGALVATTIDSQVTNSRVKSAQDLMGPFYQAIEDVDFRQSFNDAVRPALANYAIKVANVSTTPLALNDTTLRQWRSALKPGQSLMIVAPRYTLSADFRTFDAETVLTMWKQDGEDRPINRGVLRYQSAPMGTGDKDAIQRWSADKAAAFRAVVQEAVAETMQLVRVDLDVNEASFKPEQQRDFSFNSGDQQVSFKGYLVSETPTRMTVLGADSKLYSLPKLPAAAAATPK